MSKPGIVVVACGNVFAGDDGVGIEVLRELMREGLPAAAHPVEAGAPGLGLLDHMLEFDKAVIIDAVADGGAPGRILRRREEELPRKTAPPISVHDVGIRDALAYGRRSAPEMIPAEVVIIGVTVADMEAWRVGLSPAVARAVPRAVRAVRAEIERMMRKG